MLWLIGNLIFGVAGISCALIVLHDLATRLLRRELLSNDTMARIEYVFLRVGVAGLTVMGLSLLPGLH